MGTVSGVGTDVVGGGSSMLSIEDSLGARDPTAPITARIVASV